MTTAITNGAIAVHHTATVDTAWDGSAAVAAMPNDATVLKYCHAWVDDSGKPDAKSSYKLPHHKTDGGPANMAACRNGLARLPNTDIPAADKPGVERHLKAHLDDGGGDTDDHDHAHLVNGPAMTQPREWFTIRNAEEGDDGPAQVFIYDQIGGGGWFSSGIAASDFVPALNTIKNSAIDLHINSPGGDVFDAVAIYNALRRHPASVTSYIDGLAASAASFIAQAGDKVIVERNAQFMVHDASAVCLGNAADMQKMVDLLNKVSDNIADIYAQRTGVDQSTWRAVMQAEAWYSSSESVIAGLADEVGEAQEPPDDRLADTARFAPVLKAMGARYGCRGEAPDPVLVPAASARAQRNGGGPSRSAAAHPTLVRASHLTGAHVVMEPAPVVIPVPAAGAAVGPAGVVENDRRRLTDAEFAEFASRWSALHKNAPTTPPAGVDQPAFDAAAFRTAVLAGLATKKR